MKELQEQRHSLIMRLLHEEVISFLNRTNIDKADIFHGFTYYLHSEIIKTVLEFTNNNQVMASNLLGINRGTLRSKRKLYDI